MIFRLALYTPLKVNVLVFVILGKNTIIYCNKIQERPVTYLQFNLLALSYNISENKGECHVTNKPLGIFPVYFAIDCAISAAKTIIQLHMFSSLVVSAVIKVLTFYYISTEHALRKLGQLHIRTNVAFLLYATQHDYKDRGIPRMFCINYHG